MARLGEAVVRRVGGHVERERLLEPGQPVVAMVSGGADSTLLAYALCGLGHPLTLLHCAHGLRGDDSELDAGACAKLAAVLGAAFLRLEAPVSPGPGLEDRARQARRGAARSMADGRPIATGHTRDDRVETILYRLATSPGRAAFAALPPSDGAGRVRPLLEMTRQEVRAALSEAGIAWRDDPANDDRAFARNRIRLDLLPTFRSLHPTAELNLLVTASRITAERVALDAAAERLRCADGDALDVEHLARAPRALAEHALRLAAGSPAPSPAGIARALALCGSTSGSAQVPLGDGRIAERRYGLLHVHRPAVAPAPAAMPVDLAGPTVFGGLVVTCHAGKDGLDRELASAGLQIRAARRGDRLLGARSTVARQLLEARVPRAWRGRYPVVVAGADVVSLPGVCSAPAYRSANGLVFEVEGWR